MLRKYCRKTFWTSSIRHRILLQYLFLHNTVHILLTRKFYESVFLLISLSDALNENSLALNQLWAWFKISLTDWQSCWKSYLGNEMALSSAFWMLRFLERLEKSFTDTKISRILSTFSLGFHGQKEVGVFL